MSVDRRSPTWTPTERGGAETSQPRQCQCAHRSKDEEATSYHARASGVEVVRREDCLEQVLRRLADHGLRWAAHNGRPHAQLSKWSRHNASVGQQRDTSAHSLADCALDRLDESPAPWENRTVDWERRVPNHASDTTQ